MALRAVPDHPKFADLKMRLGLSKGATLGYLECIWHFTGRFTPQGNIGKYPDSAIEAWVEWEGDPGSLIAGLIESKWLDVDTEQRILVHDWHFHADKATKQAINRAKLEFHVPSVRPPVAHSDVLSSLPVPVPVPVPESVIKNIAVEVPKLSAAEIWFEAAFWPSWIRRSDDDKGSARAAAKAIAKTEAIRSSIIAAMDQQKDSRISQDPQYRKAASRWLREGGWKYAPEPPSLFVPANGPNGFGKQQYQHPERTMREVPRVHRPTKEEMEG